MPQPRPHRPPPHPASCRTPLLVLAVVAALTAGSSAGPAAPSAPVASEAGAPRVVTARADVLGPAAPLLPPVPGAGPEDVLRGFAGPLKPWGRGHRGVDVAAPGGRVVAPAAGTVRFVGSVAGRDVLTLAHADGTLSSFEPVDSALLVGQPVAAGQEVGTVSAAALHCPVRCVHWGLRREDAWQVGAARFDHYLDPLISLGWAGPSVLWPQDGPG